MIANTVDTEEVSCPKCGGEMFDNRAKKTNPKAPDFKCKRYKEGCDGVVWPPKGAKSFPKPAAVKQGYNTPRALPNEFDGYEQEETAELNARTGRGTVTVASDGLGELMAQCVAESVAAWEAAMKNYPDVGYSGDNVQGSANTLFIARKDRMGRGA